MVPCSPLCRCSRLPGRDRLLRSIVMCAQDTSLSALHHMPVRDQVLAMLDAFAIVAEGCYSRHGLDHSRAATAATPVPPCVGFRASNYSTMAASGGNSAGGSALAAAAAPAVREPRLGDLSLSLGTHTGNDPTTLESIGFAVMTTADVHCG